MVGYQADIGNGFWGDIYDKHRRGELMDGNLSTLQHLLKEDGWNSYIIRVWEVVMSSTLMVSKLVSMLRRIPKYPPVESLAFSCIAGEQQK